MKNQTVSEYYWEMEICLPAVLVGLVLVVVGVASIAHGLSNKLTHEDIVAVLKVSENQVDTIIPLERVKNIMNEHEKKLSVWILGGVASLLAGALTLGFATSILIGGRTRR